MTVKLRSGKNEIEVSGTEEQCEKTTTKWMESQKPNQDMIKVCSILRIMASNMGWEDAKNASILDIATRFSQMRDLENKNG